MKVEDILRENTDFELDTVFYDKDDFTSNYPIDDYDEYYKLIDDSIIIEKEHIYVDSADMDMRIYSDNNGDVHGFVKLRD